MTALHGDLDASRREAFQDEYLQFILCRAGIRRYMPTADQFPLFCELVAAAKKFYTRTPRAIRNSIRYLPFEYFGREWVIRMNCDLMPRPAEVYINLCDAETKTILVTVAVGFDSESLEASE